jgi:hypothetical protein
MELALAAMATFPIYFDVGGINATAFAALTPPAPRVHYADSEGNRRMRECPHPAGIVPQINKDGTIVNGGIPQRANQSLHLMTLNQTLQKYTDPADDYWMDVDFESFSLVWEREGAAGVNASIEHARLAHPGISPAQLAETARGEYEAASMAFWLATIRLIREVRPRLRLGAYNIPTRFYYDGYNSSAGPLLRAENDRVFAPIVCALDGLFPTVYQFYNSEQKPAVEPANREYVFSNIAEARRLADAATTMCLPYTPNPKRLPVIAYIWHRSVSQPLQSTRPLEWPCPPFCLLMRFDGR